MTMTDCGVAAHEEDCVCDVVIDEITEIAPIDPERYWGMRFALEWKHNVDSPESILDLLEALAVAKDTAKNMSQWERLDRWGNKRASKDLKEGIEQYLQAGNSIVDAPHHFSKPWSECVAAVTQGVPSEVWSWSKSHWAHIEAFIFEHDEWCGYRALMRKFNMGRGAAVTVQRLYRTAEHNEQAKALQCARAYMIESPRQKREWFQKKVRAHGYEITDEQVVALRTRLRETGLIPPRNVPMADWRAKHT